jgi:hypothetical protein
MAGIAQVVGSRSGAARHTLDVLDGMLEQLGGALEVHLLLDVGAVRLDGLGAEV